METGDMTPMISTPMDSRMLDSIFGGVSVGGFCRARGGWVEIVEFGRL